MSDLLKNLWDRLYAWVFPSALALGLWYYLVFPETTILHQTLDKASDPEKVGIFVTASAAIGFFLYVLYAQLYRILEGYILWPRWAQERGRKRQLRLKKEALQESRKETGWRQGLALEKIANYPFDDNQVVPTQFGNAIRAFEQYGKTRFNLDTLTLWYELCAVVPRSLQNEVESTEASVNFFVASMYLSVVFAISTLVIAVFENSCVLLMVGLLAFLVTVVSWRMALRAVAVWRRSVQALVNIGRLRLAAALGLNLPQTLSEEKRMWGLVTSHVFYADDSSGNELDRYRAQDVAVAKSAGRDGEGNALPDRAGVGES